MMTLMMIHFFFVIFIIIFGRCFFVFFCFKTEADVNNQINLKIDLKISTKILNYVFLIKHLQS